MASLSRRSVIVSVSGIVCAGCAGSTESGPALEYVISDLQDAGEVPDGVVEHPNPGGFRWIAVAVDVTDGAISSNDLYGLTQIEVGDATKPARAVDVEDAPFITGMRADRLGSEGGRISGIGLLAKEIDSETHGVADQLECEYSGVDFSRER